MSDERGHQRKDRRSYRLAGMSSRSFSSIADTIGHVDDQIPGYALGALDADEVAAVDAHVRICHSCEDSLADAQRTAGMLPFIVPMQKPPIDSKVALFARVAHTQRAAASSLLPLTANEAWRTPTIPSAAGVELTRAGVAGSPSSREGAIVSKRRIPRELVRLGTFRAAVDRPGGHRILGSSVAKPALESKLRARRASVRVSQFRIRHDVIPTLTRL